MSDEKKDVILIVDDNSETLDFLRSVFINDYRVVTASNGLSAVQLTSEFQPSLVLADVMMPGLNGLEFVSQLKANSDTSYIPIILLTGKNDLRSKLEGLKYGVDDYVTKPFSADELSLRIRNLIQTRKKIEDTFREKFLLSPRPSQELSRNERFLIEVKTIIQERMGDAIFSVEELADRVNLNRTQLLRNVKSLTGLSPSDFIKSMRMNKAAELIRKRTDTITQICYQVGFNDQSYFTKCFKRHFGMTPRDYWREHERH